MKALQALLAASVALRFVGCQSARHASRSVSPNLVEAPGQLSYVFDERFGTYFGPAGIAEIEQTLRDLHPGYEIHVTDGQLVEVDWAN